MRFKSSRRVKIRFSKLSSYTRKAVVDQTYICNSSFFCKTVVRIDASQIYSFSVCQEIPNGLFTGWEFDSETERFSARSNNKETSITWSCPVLLSRIETRLYKKFLSNGKQNKTDCLHVDGYWDHCKTVFENMGCYYHFSSCQETHSSLSEQDFERR